MKAKNSSEREVERTYTLSQIKQAYWAKFHKAGELWFAYLGSEEENEEATNSSWEDFLEELEKSDNKDG